MGKGSSKPSYGSLGGGIGKGSSGASFGGLGSGISKSPGLPKMPSLGSNGLSNIPTLKKTYIPKRRAVGGYKSMVGRRGGGGGNGLAVYGRRNRKSMFASAAAKQYGEPSKPVGSGLPSHGRRAKKAPILPSFSRHHSRW